MAMERLDRRGGMRRNRMKRERRDSTRESRNLVISATICLNLPVFLPYHHSPDSPLNSSLASNH
jgi:hypothetical protein